eukprot:6144085-Pleurochrysis_carterae.AAC.1
MEGGIRCEARRKAHVRSGATESRAVSWASRARAGLRAGGRVHTSARVRSVRVGASKGLNSRVRACMGVRMCVRACSLASKREAYLSYIRWSTGATRRTCSRHASRSGQTDLVEPDVRHGRVSSTRLGKECFRTLLSCSDRLSS